MFYRQQFPKSVESPLSDDLLQFFFRGIGTSSYRKRFLLYYFLKQEIPKKYNFLGIFFSLLISSLLQE